MNASSPISTTVQVALAIGGAAFGRYVMGWSLALCVLFGVAVSYPITLLLVAIGARLSDRSTSD